MKESTPIKTEDLKHGAYYEGSCRNASLARWDATRQRFVHWRHKFGFCILEEIPNHEHPDWKYDWFIADGEVSAPTQQELQIPFWNEYGKE